MLDRSSAPYLIVPDAGRTIDFLVQAFAAVPLRRISRAGGGISVQEPSKGDDPDRRGGVQDHSGVTWWIATQLAAE